MELQNTELKQAEAAAASKHRRRLKGGALAFVGYMLSPLSWWNDAFVNVPLALAFAWIVSFFAPAWFSVSFVAGYWLTNVLGFVLMHKGGQMLVRDKPAAFGTRQLIESVLVSLAYTLLIVALIELKLLQPLPEYLPKH